jgi:glycosyltransferase involved in cell wall biosynthesis
MKKKILIATPCYGNVVGKGYFESMLHTMVYFGGSKDVELNVFTMGNESLVTRARNVCVANMLKGNYTHILFIDADIEFSPEVIERLVKKDEDVVCAVYPQKKICWEKLPTLDIKDLTTEDIQARLMNYNVHISKIPGVYNKEIGKDYFMEVDRAATGFMLIKRTVFTKMMKAYPELRYYSDDESENHINDHLWAFFDCGIDERKKYMSEDYMFCDRWTKLGGKIYVDVISPLKHVGNYTFNGSFVQSLNLRKT